MGTQRAQACLSSDRTRRRLTSPGDSCGDVGRAGAPPIKTVCSHRRAEATPEAAYVPEGTVGGWIFVMSLINEVAQGNTKVTTA